MDSGYSAETAEGTLVIMVCRAKHLPNRRRLDKQSPYVLLRMNTVAKKTPSHFRAGQTPEWTHEIRFQLSRDRKPAMRLDVLDETKSDPTPIGGVEIDCSAVFTNPSNLQDSGKYILDSWYDLKFKDRYAGKIYLEMTFYPSAPVLPPKLSASGSAYKLLPEPPAADHAHYVHSAPASPRAQSPVDDDDDDDVFVGGPARPAHAFRTSSPEKPVHDGVFAEPQPKTSRFSKIKDRLRAKDPLSALWSGDRHRDKRADASPELPTMEPFECFAAPPLPSPAQMLEHTQCSAPPPPPPHSHSGSESHHAPASAAFSPERAFLRPAESNPEPAARAASPRKGRKPPPSTHGGGPAFADPKVFRDSTNIPFSADNFQLDDADDLPTNVYRMGEKVKSLSITDSGSRPHTINPDEIDPRYYAPTPTEHLVKSMRLSNGHVLRSDMEVDLNTDKTGYMGEGRWSADGHKFSPSVFQRINNENDDKPRVPPKVPQGLSDKEYYVLERDSFLKDVNGRRF